MFHLELSCGLHQGTLDAKDVTSVCYVITNASDFYVF
jgi:hypothetical protein